MSDVTVWKHYQITQVESEWWRVLNLKTRKVVNCSSENAAYSIVELATALREGEPKPRNHTTLERKARDLEGLEPKTFWNLMGHPYTQRQENNYTIYLAHQKQKEKQAVTN